MSFDLDALIDDAVVYGELSDGTDAAWLAQRMDPRRVAVMANVVTERGIGKDREWTAEEDAFIREQYMFLSDEELGQRLGRTAAGVHIHRERKLGIAGRSQNPAWPNLREVGRLLGLPCSKLVGKLVRRGILRGRKLPLEATVWVVARGDLLRFVVNPRNWIYFKTERVQDPQLRKLVAIRKAMWGDEWWSPGQVAAYHGVSIGVVNKYIHLGQLPAVRWYNWHILRSDGVRFPFRRGRQNWSVIWTSDAADGFLILGRAIGLSWGVLDRLMGKQHSDARFANLRRGKRLAEISQRQGLAVKVDEPSGRLYADWRQWPGRFPCVEKSVERFLNGHVLKAEEARLLLGIFCAWLSWHAGTEEQRATAARLQYRTGIRMKSVRRTYEALVALGFELR
ncbi:MAG: hypothetical protein AB7R40_22355 [Nitrospiraceae bacterium]